MIEIVATTLEDALIIEECGVDRIELVSALSEGGITPSYGLIKKVVQTVKIPVNVIIRPHARSFVYSKEEIEIMKEDIRIARNCGANGVVFGILDENANIHIKFLEELLEICENLDLEVTFHKAIDKLADIVEGVKILSQYSSIKTILTSGGKGDIVCNIHRIKQMMNHSGHITIMPGGGLTFENIEKVARATGARAFHFGTAVRQNSSPNGKIDKIKLTRMIKIIESIREEE